MREREGGIERDGGREGVRERGREEGERGRDIERGREEGVRERKREREREGGREGGAILAYIYGRNIIMKSNLSSYLKATFCHFVTPSQTVSRFLLKHGIRFLHFLK